MLRICASIVVPLFVLMASAGNGAALSENWQRVLDLPSANVYAATFATDAVAWSAGGGGIFRSEDRGRTWRVALTTSRFLADIDGASDGVHGWAVGILGEALYTADGGETWTGRDVGSDLILNLVEVLDADSAIVAGDGEGDSDVVIEARPHTIRRTDDGGKTWREINLDGFSATSINFLDAEVGWIAGRHCEPPPEGSGFGCSSRAMELFRTKDGGTTWKRVGGEALYRDLAFTSEDDGWAIRSACASPMRTECSSSVAVTHDGGESWKDLRSVPVDIAFRQLSVFANGAVLVHESYCDAGETNGQCANHLIETTDGGDTWTEVRQFEAGKSASAIAVAPAGHAISFAYSGTPAYYSPDRRDWRPAEFPLTLGTGAYDFIDARSGWFAASKLLRTIDSGTTWEPISDLDPVALDFVSATDGWASTLAHDPATQMQRATLQHTTDGGRTWQVQYDREFGNYLYLSAVDTLNAWAYSLYDRLLLHTRDGGASWNEQPVQVAGNGNSPSITFVDARVGWSTETVCGPEPTYCAIRTWITRDGGDTWSATSTTESRGGGGCPTRIEAVSAQHAWIATSDCRDIVRPYVLRTTDGGASWQRIDIGGIGDVTAIDFLDPRFGRLIRAHCIEPSSPCTDALWRTQDGGLTWTRELTDMQIYGDVQFVSPERAWRLEQDGGGVFAVSRHQLFRFVGTGPNTLPPLRPPDTGSGRMAADSAPAVVVLLLAGGALIAAAGLAMNCRRPSL